jgi:hypothetical protein
MPPNKTTHSHIKLQCYVPYLRINFHTITFYNEIILNYCSMCSNIILIKTVTYINILYSYWQQIKSSSGWQARNWHIMSLCKLSIKDEAARRFKNETYCRNMSVFRVNQFSVRFSYYYILCCFIDFINVGNHVWRSAEIWAWNIL